MQWWNRLRSNDVESPKPIPAPDSAARRAEIEVMKGIINLIVMLPADRRWPTMEAAERMLEVATPRLEERE